MEMAKKTSADRREQVFQRLDQFSDQMAEVKAIQKELLGQSALATAVAEQAAEERTLLFLKVEETGKVVAQLRLEAMGRSWSHHLLIPMGASALAHALGIDGLHASINHLREVVRLYRTRLPIVVMT
jgi:hypothetical protein